MLQRCPKAHCAGQRPLELGITLLDTSTRACCLISRMCPLGVLRNQLSEAASLKGFRFFTGSTHHLPRLKSRLRCKLNR